MTNIVLKPLADDDLESVYALAKSVYLNGHCYEFALALHEGLGWPLVGLVHEDVICHAALLTPDKVYFDVRGRRPTHLELAQDINALPEGYTVTSLTREKLLATGKINPVGVTRALWMAQALWPNLGWKKGPLVRYQAFVEELYALSEKHGIFILAPFPTAMPILTEAHGDESYALQPSSTSDKYFFNRILDSEK